jgi:3-dehydroquinate dehydratase / shikimate dehydrogenase
MPKIVATVTAATMAELRAARDAVTSADMVELRLDGVRDIDVAGALAGRAKPVIVTCRAAWEGGRFAGSEEERLGILAAAMRHGAEFVDLEWKADRRAFPDPAGQTAVVLSHHNFKEMPADLDELVRAMRSDHDGIVKIAVSVSNLRDCLRLRQAVKDSGPHVAIGMGAAGQITRVWPAGYGSVWTYGGSAAPGQTDPCVLIDGYRAGRTTTATRLFGIVGSPVEHSASPAMHNAAFAAAGLDAVYVPLETADVSDFMTFADEMRLEGVSITAPLKRDVFARVGATDEVSTKTGAVNTLRRGPSGWEARNFDVAGFLAPLDRRSARIRGQQVVVLGAGGAARSAVWALKAHGARVALSARRPEQAARLADELGVETRPWPPPPDWDLLVNTTPVGTWPSVHESPLPRERVRGPLVYDLVYNPADTQLLIWARDAGAETISGMDMLVAQAAAQFEWWTGQPAPVDIMRRAASEFVGALRPAARALRPDDYEANNV